MLIFKDFWIVIVCTLLPILFGVPMFVILVDIFGVITKRTFAAKWSKQLSLLGLITYILLAVYMLVETFLFYYPQGILLQSFDSRLTPIIYLLPVIGVSFYGLYMSLWKYKRKYLRLLMGIISIIFLKITAWAIVFSLLFPQIPALLTPNDLLIFIYNIPVLISGIDLNTIIIVASLVFYPLTFASSTAILYLFSRRNKDDFGRDYYKYALSKNATFGFIFSILMSIAPIMFIAFHKALAPFDKPYTVFVMVTLCFALLSFLSNLLLVCSKNPMRLKFVGIFNFLFCVLFSFSMFVTIATYAQTGIGLLLSKTFGLL